MSEPKTIYSTIKLLYYITKIIGLAPFRIKNNCFEKSLIGVIWSISLLILLHVYTLITWDVSVLVGMGFMEKLTCQLDLISTQVGMFCGILGNCLYSNRVSNSL